MSDAPPLWMDAATLARNLCICERTVDAWTKQGLLPAPFTRGGKRLWKWKTVEEYLEGRNKDAPPSPEQHAREITDATRRAAKAKQDRNRNFCLGDTSFHVVGKIPGLS